MSAQEKKALSNRVAQAISEGDLIRIDGDRRRIRVGGELRPHRVSDAHDAARRPREQDARPAVLEPVLV